MIYYLHEILKAITIGEVDEVLASRDPGEHDPARWVRLACQLARKYVSTKNPLQILSQS